MVAERLIAMAIARDGGIVTTDGELVTDSVTSSFYLLKELKKWGVQGREEGSSMFLTRKNSRGHLYYQLAENYWDKESKTVKQRMLAHLGKDLTEPKALIKWWEALGKPQVPLKKGRDPGTWFITTSDLRGYINKLYDQGQASELEFRRIKAALEYLTRTHAKD